MVVTAPLPSEMTKIITSVNTGLLRNTRPANRRSATSVEIDVLPAVVAHLFAHGERGTDVAARRAARIGRGQALLDVRLGRLLDVVRQLLVELVVCLLAPGEDPDACSELSPE